MQASAIDQVLDRMHGAILIADFAALAALTPELETALAGLRQPDQAVLQRVAGKAARNAACLQAAGRGVRAALRRVTEVRQATAGLVTYDGSGKRTAPGEPGQLARRF